MIATLIGRNYMNKIVLPTVRIGSYWITDKSGEKEVKLVNIEGENGNWKVTSNESVQIINPAYFNSSNSATQQNIEKVVKQVTLKEYDMYYINIEASNEMFILYCAPAYEGDFLHLNVKNSTEITIGNGTQNTISYNNPLIATTHARLLFFNGKWTIKNFDSVYGTFVNNRQIYADIYDLNNGDIISIMGFKIVIMGMEIFINNPAGRIKYNSQVLALNEDKQDWSNLKKEDDQELELYSEKDYFARAPRIKGLIETEKVRIDPPPTRQDPNEMPMIFVLGSTLSMGVMMMVSMANAIEGMTSGTATVKQTIFTFAIALAMLASTILFPMLNEKYNRKRRTEYEEKRQEKYKEYLESKAKQIEEIMDKQRDILYDNYLSAEECSQIILSKSPRLWERKIEERDFLTVRVGTGDVPLKIDISYPEDRFTMDDDNLMEILHEIGEASSTLQSVPITLSLTEKNVSALIAQNNTKIADNFMQSLIMQLVTFHSYDDLKLVFLLKEDVENKWDYIKMLPHVWNNTKQIRFIAEDYNEMKEISSFLEEELKNRAQYADRADYKSFAPYYLIITDDYKKIENLKIITELLKLKANVGFSLLCITDNIMQLPNECKTFIKLEDGQGIIFESEVSSNNQRQFQFDVNPTFFFEKICKEISNIPIRLKGQDRMLLPNNYTFLEMYDVGRVEQLNILERWKNNNSVLSLQAPIGIDPSGMPISLDVHERFHGPHGLIAGSTGSGKSEFIITYILSLAINYNPNDVAFILIDYKGGGLAGAFQKQNIKLPHLIGTITNIDTVGLQRSLASIQSELRRRQVMFNEARNKTDEGTIDIYKYQKLYHNGIVDEPIPHLLIICDEFAELKQQQQDFMSELISVARIGRSLGVHLILATQKPAGIVDDQIRSNSKFAVCLKVQDKSDSNDVIKRPDAASLKQTGEFYLEVGNDEYFVLGQSAWSGAPYQPSDRAKKKVDTSIQFINNIGLVVKETDNASQKGNIGKGEQLTNIVRYIYELAKQENIKTRQLWLDDVPAVIYLKDLKQKYKVKYKENEISPVIGEYDDPYNQHQDVVRLNLSNNGNTIIYGNAESGKETLLSSLVYDVMTSYTTNQVQSYILDFGSEALKIFKGSPHVGDVIFINDKEKINRFFDKIKNEIRRRTKTLSDYGGNYQLYVNTSGNKMPLIIIIINNYEGFSESYADKYEEDLLSITREGIQCGISFVITASTFHDIRYRLSQNFKQKIALRLNSDDDYINILDGVGKKRPSNIFGRGLVNINDEIFEFQTAQICKGEDWNSHVKQTIEDLSKSGQEKAEPIPTLPEKVLFTDVKSSLKDLTSIPIGITEKDLSIYSYNFKKNFATIIASKNIDLVAQFTSNIMEEMQKLINLDVFLFDAERTIQTNKAMLIESYNKFEERIEQGFIKTPTICIVIGIDKFLNDIEGGDSRFAKMMKSANEKGNYCFIIAENFNKLKNHQYDEWYKSNIVNDNGIWVGNGIKDQYVISCNSNDRDIINNCGDNFGYAVKQGMAVQVKLLEMKGENNE